MGREPVTIDDPGDTVVFPVDLFHTEGKMGIGDHSLKIQKSGCYEMNYTAIFDTPDAIGGWVYLTDGTEIFGEKTWNTIGPDTVMLEWEDNAFLTAGRDLKLVVKGDGVGPLVLRSGSFYAQLIHEGSCLA